MHVVWAHLWDMSIHRRMTVTSVYTDRSRNWIYKTECASIEMPRKHSVSIVFFWFYEFEQLKVVVFGNFGNDFHADFIFFAFENPTQKDQVHVLFSHSAKWCGIERTSLWIDSNNLIDIPCALWCGIHVYERDFHHYYDVVHTYINVSSMLKHL